jgi:hypothetical protein
MFLVEGIFGLAQAMGTIPALVAASLLLGSSAIALVTNSPIFALVMRGIESITAGFLLSVLMGTFGQADGGSLGVLLGARLAAFMSLPIAAALCAVTAALGIWLALEGNVRQILASRFGPAAESAKPTFEWTKKPAEWTRQALKSAAWSSTAFDERESAEEEEMPTQQPVAEYSAVAVEEPVAAPPVDSEVRLRPRKSDAPPGGGSTPPDEPQGSRRRVRIDDDTSPSSETAVTAQVTSVDGLLTPESPAEVTPSAEIEVPTSWPPTPLERLGESGNPEPANSEFNEPAYAPQSDVDSNLGNGNDQQNDFASLDAGGDPGLFVLVEPGRAGGIVGGLVEPSEGVAGAEKATENAEATEDADAEAEDQEYVRRRELRKQEYARRRRQTQGQESAGERGAGESQEYPESKESGENGAAGRGEPEVLAVEIPEIAYVEESWDLPRTIPGAPKIVETQESVAETQPAVEIPARGRKRGKAKIPMPGVVQLLFENVEPNEMPLPDLVKEYDLAHTIGNAPAATQQITGGPQANAHRLDRAVQMVLGEGRASISFLQRKLEIPFGDAQRIMLELETAGVVGPYQGNPARDILLTLSEWEARRATS